jgi:hypothetical protein
VPPFEYKKLKKGPPGRPRSRWDQQVREEEHGKKLKRAITLERIRWMARLSY